jgi:hypothetical protein
MFKTLLTRKKRRAFVIPVVILLGVVMLMFLFFMVNNMMQTKSMKLATTHTTKAYFMAQAAIQHMKLKYKLLPQESFNAGFLQYGYNPWYNDVIDDFSKGGNKYPQFIASTAVDVTTLPTVAERKFPMEPKEGVSEMTRFKGLPMDAGGFELDSGLPDENITEWGYELVRVKSGSVRYDPPEKPTTKEQSIEFTVIGWARQDVGAVARDERKDGEAVFIKQWEAKETLILKSKYTGKDYGR